MSCRDGVRVNRPGYVQCNKATEMALPGQFTNLSLQELKADKLPQSLRELR